MINTVEQREKEIKDKINYNIAYDKVKSILEKVPENQNRIITIDSAEALLEKKGLIFKNGRCSRTKKAYR